VTFRIPITTIRAGSLPATGAADISLTYAG